MTGKDPCWDCTVTKPHSWTRLPAVKALKGKTLQLFKDGVGCGDIQQGSIGTCWLLAAIAAVAGNKHSDRLEKLFCEYDIDVGVYGIRFCIDGEWTYIIVDDQFGLDRYGRLLYAKNPNDQEEVWVPVLEKAFCKLYTNYEMCDGGRAGEALVTFFGGLSDILRPSKRDMTEPVGFFKRLVDGQCDIDASFTSVFVTSRTLMRCTDPPFPQKGRQRTPSLPCGGWVASHLCHFMLTRGCTFW